MAAYEFAYSHDATTKGNAGILSVNETYFAVACWRALQLVYDEIEESGGEIALTNVTLEFRSVTYLAESSEREDDDDDDDEDDSANDDSAA